LFLDEIGDMPRLLQAKLLRVLESGEFAPLGSEKEVTADAWVIASTNQNLGENVKKGLFREDLYYRLNIIKIYIPPLRNRPEDIPPLIDYFIEKYASQFDRNKISKPDSDTMEKLMTCSWPGNVRELQSILQSCMVIGNWKEVVDDLSIKDKPDVYSTSDPKGLNKALIVDTILDLKNENSPGSPGHASFSLKKIRKEAKDTIDKEVISFVLDKTGWNRTKASKILKISYKTLLNRISDLDIKPSTPNR
jgi:two-component system response regulator AtoC